MIEKNIARVVRIIMVGIGLPLICPRSSSDDLLHGKFKTFKRMKCPKAGEIASEITTEH